MQNGRDSARRGKAQVRILQTLKDGSEKVRLSLFTRNFSTPNKAYERVNRPMSFRVAPSSTGRVAFPFFAIS
jgi:hypothetical protein